MLCNPVGGPCRVGPDGVLGVQRSPWEWCRALVGDVNPPTELPRLIAALLNGAVHNLGADPRAVWRVANLARHALLLDQVRALSHRELPLEIVWSDHDKIVPRRSFEAMCDAAEVDGMVVAGSHCWPLTHPDLLAELVLQLGSTRKSARRKPSLASAARRRRGPSSDRCGQVGTGMDSTDPGSDCARRIAVLPDHQHRSGAVA